MSREESRYERGTYGNCPYCKRTMFDDEGDDLKFDDEGRLGHVKCVGKTEEEELVFWFCERCDIDNNIGVGCEVCGRTQYSGGLH